ncbi:MAG: GNAT family N-acetyltransferase [Legionellales bacterium]
MIINISQLDDKQLKDLEDLRIRCKKENGSTPNLYTHILAQPRALPACLLYYKDNTLMGFLSAFFFYQNAVEIALLVDPAIRRQGLATELLKTILPLLQQHGFLKLIFSSPHLLNNSWLPASNCSFLHSEYFMMRDDLSPVIDGKQSLHFRTATHDDIPVLYSLDEACFHKKPDEAIGRFNNLIDNREYHLIVALQNNHPIGKAHIRWEPQGASLSDIAIIPALQGKGLGTALIAYCINYALSEGRPNVSLDVETHNQRALHLYTQLGFTIKNACDYWTINIDQLKLKTSSKA